MYAGSSADEVAGAAEGAAEDAGASEVAGAADSEVEPSVASADVAGAAEEALEAPDDRAGAVYACVAAPVVVAGARVVTGAGAAEEAREVAGAFVLARVVVAGAAVEEALVVG